MQATEPKDKLDAMVATAAGVNGPEDDLDRWAAIDWRTHEDNVARLRQRIFKATQDGDPRRVRQLQRLMLRSWSNTLVSVRQVTQRNAGRRTAGVDRELALSPRARMELADSLGATSPSAAGLPVRRVYIPKANGKLRPLGIPVISDRVQQARVKNALEPEWEARFEPRSYGFRPGRGCHDAIDAIYRTLCGRATRVWVLDADLTGAFDHIDHDRLMANLGSFPARGAIRGWLKAGVMDRGQLAPTLEGTPQGGVISPLLLNVALHGMEQAAGVRYRNGDPMDAKTVNATPALVRYADDYVAMCYSASQAEEVRARLAAWLAPRGLSFNEDKTKIVHAEDGFSFLGCNVRRYVTADGSTKLLIKPSQKSVERLRERLASEMASLRGANAPAVIARLNPVIRGWTAYYRGVVSSRTFSGLDEDLWHLTWRWACRTHPNKSKHWVKARYFGRFNRARADRWVFGDRATGAYLARFSWTRIVRHVPVRGRASPDDPALAAYWAERRRRRPHPLLDNDILALLHLQDDRCPACGEALIDFRQEPQSPQQWEEWFASLRPTLRKQRSADPEGTPADERARFRLVHARCLRAARRRSTHATLPA